MKRSIRPFGRLAPSLMLLVLALGVAAGANAAQTDSVTVTFQTLNDSGVTGTATLTAVGDQTRVVLSIKGAPGEHPDHIHRSTCADPEPTPTYPLSDVVLSQADQAGQSETLVDVPLSTLLTEDYLILIHKSADEIGVYYACADIDVSGPMPATGVGSALADAGANAQLTGLLLIAAVLLSLAGLRLNRTQGRAS
jgi:hypothetical protein